MGAVAAAVADAVGTVAASIGAGTAAGVAADGAIIAPTLFGSEMAATGVAGGLLGAAGGAGLGGIQAAITGGDIWKAMGGGALGGMVTGGLMGPLGGELGNIPGGIVAGGLGGLTNAGVTGGNLGTGALMGGAAGGVMGALGGGTTPGANAPTGVESAAASGGGGGDLASLGDIQPGMPSAGPGVGATSTLPGGTTPVIGGDSSVSFQPTNVQQIAAYTDAAGNPVAALPTVDVPGPTQGGFQGYDANGQLIGAAPQASTGALSGNNIATVQSPNSVQPELSPADAAKTLGVDLPATPSATGAAGGQQGPSAWQQFKDNPSLAGAGKVAMDNPKLALGALGLGASSLMGQQQPKGMNQMSSAVQQLAAQGGQLQGALNGALPPAAQGALNQAANSAKAHVRSQYAQMGLSGSTMEAQAMASVDESVAAQGYQMTMQLYQAGVQESGMANALFNQIMQTNQAQSQGLSSAVANFAGALAGNSGNGKG